MIGVDVEGVWEQFQRLTDSQRERVKAKCIAGFLALVVAGPFLALLSIQFCIFLAMRQQFGPEAGEALYERYSRALSSKEGEPWV